MTEDKVVVWAGRVIKNEQNEPTLFVARNLRRWEIILSTWTNYRMLSFLTTQIDISLVGKIINAINLDMTPVSSSRLSRTGRKDSLLFLFLGTRGHHVADALGQVDAHSLLGQEIDEQRTRLAVSIGLRSGLALLILENVVEIHVKQIRRVQRTALGFGMELSGEDGTRLVDQTYSRLACGSKTHGQ